MVFRSTPAARFAIRVSRRRTLVGKRTLFGCRVAAPVAAATAGIGDSGRDGCWEAFSGCSGVDDLEEPADGG